MPVPASALTYVKPTPTVFELEALEGLPCGCVAAAYRARPWDVAVVSLEAGTTSTHSSTSSPHIGASARDGLITTNSMPRGGRRLPEACVERIAAADLLLHAGDLMTVEVLRELGERVEVDVFGEPRYVFPTRDCAILPIGNSTAEMLAEYLAGQLQDELAARGDSQAALAEYAAAHREQPDSIELAFWHGAYLAAVGREEDARQTAKGLSFFAAEHAEQQHVVAEPARADHGGDDDHVERQHDHLVDADHQRRPRGWNEHAP